MLYLRASAGWRITFLPRRGQLASEWSWVAVDEIFSIPLLAGPKPVLNSHFIFYCSAHAGVVFIKIIDSNRRGRLVLLGDGKCFVTLSQHRVVTGAVKLICK